MQNRRVSLERHERQQYMCKTGHIGALRFTIKRRSGFVSMIGKINYSSFSTINVKQPALYTVFVTAEQKRKKKNTK